MKHRIVFPLPSTLAADPSAKALRFYSIGEIECIDSAILFNDGPCGCVRWEKKLWAIHAPCGNFGHCLAILWADECDALDVACDENLLDSLMISEADQKEWHAATPDSENEEWTRLGNASEPFDLSDVTLTEIPPSVWQADWEFVHACGRCAGGENIKTAADL